MLKKPASSSYETREAYLVKRRSFPDSDVSRTTTVAFLSMYGNVLPWRAQGRTIDRLKANIVFLSPAKRMP
jgi:hypothetical protein